MRSRKLGIVLAVLVLVLAACIGIVAAKLAERRRPARAAEDPDYDSGSEEWGGTISYGGKTYTLDRSLTSILFLGVDYGSDRDADANVGTGGRADTIIVLILDDESKTTKLLSVSRDTITEVDVYDQKGDFAYSGPMHINLQYTFGDSDMRSCYLQKRTVSELLYGIRLDGCLSVSLDGFAALLDSLGGLDVTFDEDYSFIDARFAKGASVHMNGADAERFVRWRDTGAVGSNDDRMKRQSWIAEQLFRQFTGRIGASRLEEIIDTASNHIYSDLDAETLKKLSSYPVEDVQYTVPGASREGELHDEFYVDEDALKDLLVSLYYVEKQ